MNLYPWIRYIPALVLAAAITFSGRTFVLGSIDPSWTRNIIIRLEDIVILCIGLGLLLRMFLIGQIRVKSLPLMPWFFLWIFIELISSLVNSIVVNLAPLRILFYTLKLSEYAFIFYFIYAFVKTERDLRILMTGWMVYIWIHLAYIFYQFILPDHPGIWLIGEQGNFNIGVQFLVLALFSLSYFLFVVLAQPDSLLKKCLKGLIFIAPLIGVFTPGIKAGAVAGIVGSGLLLVAYLTKVPLGISLKRVGILIACIGIMLFSLASATKYLPYDFIKARTLNFSSYFVSLNFRANIWVQHLQRLSEYPLHVVIGRGGGDPYAEASHNQYVRNLSAGGLVGSLAFFILIGSLLRSSFLAYWKGTKPLAVAFGAGLFVATIGMLITGISGESFFVVRPAEHFWYFAGLAYAAIILQTSGVPSKI